MSKRKPPNNSETVKQDIEESYKVSLSSQKQRNIYKSIINNTITLIKGPAGTGKTFVSSFAALSLLFDSESSIERVIITRLAAETCGEKIGALPGGLNEKLQFIADPILDNLYQMYHHSKIDELIKSRKLEIIPISFLRGRSFHNTIVLLDEAQNLSYEMVLTILTRISFGSKLVITGDPDQYDIHGRQGLKHVEALINGLPSCAVFKLGVDDIQRHPLVRMIVERSIQLKSSCYL